MKKKWVIIPMIASWFVFIALDSALGLFRAGHRRKTGNSLRMLYLLINYLRGSTIFIIAILNFLLVAGSSWNQKKKTAY